MHVSFCYKNYLCHGLGNDENNKLPCYKMWQNFEEKFVEISTSGLLFDNKMNTKMLIETGIVFQSLLKNSSIFL